MQVSRLVKAPPAQVYQAFLDPLAVGAWMAPGSMRLHVHVFDARLGGRFRISLTYPDPPDAQRGKTTGDTDTYHGYFAELVPDEKIVEVIEFESRDPGFAGEMTMTVLLRDVEGGTEVTLVYDNLPPGIRPEDNEAGTRASLAKLAALLE
jgi:uncharacterized protein YndB with AHSA1/START domain